MEYFKLANGVLLPAVGTGTNTFGRDNDDLMSKPTGNFSAMYDAIKSGYEFYDSAISYGNEEGISDCLQESDISRDKLFILSKIPNRAPYNVDRDSIRRSVKESLERMRMDYYDLYLVHQAVDPNIAKQGGKMDKEKTLALYAALEDLYEEGVFRAIGVANFNVEQLKILLDHCKIAPMVNQIRINPACRNLDTVEFCKQNGIVPMAHSPLNFTAKPFVVDEAKKVEFKERAIPIGEKYGKSWAQVLLRWNYQMEICSIPKSSNPKNQVANLDIFDFALTDEEMQILL